jgi:REP element-mobilizing transposase RayT
MALPRSKYVQEGQEGVYHCFSRCVRRAFLYGFDAVTRRDFSHRKAWLVERLRFLAAIFAIEVCAYAVMENHYHTVLRTRPDIVSTWTDQEVARRWLKLFPRHRDLQGADLPPAEKDIRTLTDCPERIAQLRERLSSLSWFMGRLNEYMARAANKEDKVKGRFWESRFKCQALLDEAAIAACMVYVDLNPIRAGLAGSPELSDFTSIQERIRAWQKEAMTLASVSSQEAEGIQTGSSATDMSVLEKADRADNPTLDPILTGNKPIEEAALSTCWLCPIESDYQRRGILQMTTTEYIDLVDMSGRMIRFDKRGAIDADLAPILLRIGANPEAWLETVSRFGSKFRLAAGLLSNLRRFADQLGRQWLKGVASARAAFAASPPQLA